MARGDRRKCKCCLKLFRPDPRNRRHQRTAPLPGAKQPARRRARRIGSPNPSTTITSPTPYTSPGSAAGGRAILGTGAGRDVPAVRYKMSQWRKLLVCLGKRPISCGHRYKTSYRRNALFWLA
jgi:hypothetical protein